MIELQPQGGRLPAGAEACSAICRTLESLGVRHVFGVPGTQNVALFEALRRSSLTTIVPTHELAATFMAGAYYRASGRPGVVATIGGPGLAYAIAGLAEARLDSAALVYLVNARPADAIVGYGLQALDQRALLAPVVKAVLTSSGHEPIAEVLRRAFEIATTGEPGPVAIELGGDGDQPCSPAPQSTCRREHLRDVATLLWQRIASARRPLLMLGQGAIASAHEIKALAERLGAPVLTTPSARGIIAESHPLALGFDVLKGTLPRANELLATSDLVVVLGAKLGHNGSAGFGLELPPGKSVRVDTSAEALTAVYPGRHTLCADVAAFLAHPAAKSVGASDWTASEIARWRARIGTTATTEPEPNIAGQPARTFFDGLRAALPDAGMLVTDTGMHQVLSRRYYEVRSPRGLLAPSDFQSMGFGLPAAIAAKLADPSRSIVALLGDGGFRMTGFELGTAIKAKLSLPVIVFNDGKLNQIRLQQLAQYGTSSSTDLGPLDFARFAAAMGIAHCRTGRLHAEMIGKALSAGQPTLIEVPVGDSLAVTAGALRATAARQARTLLPQAWKQRLAALRPARP